MHTCPLTSGNTPHSGGPCGPKGSPDVFIGGLPAMRVGDMAVCNGPVDQIAAGSQTVNINGLPAARQGDSTSHGGTIVQGFAMVNIG